MQCLVRGQYSANDLTKVSAVLQVAKLRTLQ